MDRLSKVALVTSWERACSTHSERRDPNTALNPKSIHVEKNLPLAQQHHQRTVQSNGCGTRSFHIGLHSKCK